MSYFGSNPPLDSAQFELIRRVGGRDLLAQKAQVFVADSAKLLGAARGALCAGDAGEVRHTLHALRANSVDFGAHSMASLCAVAERLAKDRRLEDCGPLIDRIASEHDSVRRALQTLILGS